MKPTLMLLALFIGWTLPAADRPGGKLTVKRDIQYYDIRGRTPNELRKALDAQGPLNPVGKKRFDARTDWTLQWTYKWDGKLAKQAGFFRLSEWTVDVKSTIILPRWVELEEAKPFDQRRWQIYMARLKLHENGHAKLAELAGDAANKAFANLKVYPSSEKLKEAVRLKAQEILKLHRAMELEYDQKTDHGKKQGARFP
jgi:predicted secreted Zn-dependent protease